MSQQRERIMKVIKDTWAEFGEVPFPLYDGEAESLAIAVLNAVYERPEVMFLGMWLAIPLADVQHVEKQRDTGGLMVITRHTRWDMERDCWANNVWIDVAEADAFMEAWTRYLTRSPPERLVVAPVPKV